MMSRIDKLIKEKCPNGVEYKSIDFVVNLYYGKGNNIPKDGGDYPVYGCFGIVGSTSNYNNEDTPIVGHIGSAGKVTWGKGKHFVTYNGTICKTKDSQVLNSRFLYYILQNLNLEKYVKGSQPFLSSSDFGPIKIPVPPIEVQEEIVRILDKFDELEAELEVELEARKSQYEFWRGKLLDNDYDECTLDSVCLKVNNINWKSEEGNLHYIDLSSVNRDNNMIEETSIINASTAPSRARQVVKADDILFGTTRPMLKRITIVPEKYDNQICSTGYCVLRPNQEMILPKWLYFSLQTSKYYDYVENFQQGTSYPSISDSLVKNYKISLPSLEQQEQIMEVLDKFDKLVNDITVGLPAEIEARRKQYEYYRNKLLSFEELTNE